MRESAHPGASAWDVSTSNFKTSILWLSFAISWRLYIRRNGLPQHPFQRHVAENVTLTKDCMLLRYQIYILTSCEFVDDLQMGISIDFGHLMDMHYRFPYFFEGPRGQFYSA